MPVDPAGQLALVVNTLARIALEEMCQRAGGPLEWAKEEAAIATDLALEKLEGNVDEAFRSIFGHMLAVIAAREAGSIEDQAADLAVVIGLSGVLMRALQEAALTHGTRPEDLSDIGASARILVERAAT